MGAVTPRRAKKGNMNLFNIDKNVYELIENGFNADCLDVETGEVDVAKAETYFEDLVLDRDVKLENYGKYIKNLEAEITALKEQEDSFKARREQKARRVEALKKAVLNSMLLFGDKKFERTDVLFTTRESQKVEVDMDVLSAEYTRVKTTIEADKTKLKNALKNGETINGAQLVTNYTLTVK